MKHFSPLLIGVYVLVFRLSFYYPIILMTSLAFFPVNTVPYRQHWRLEKYTTDCIFLSINFTENILQKTMEVAFPRP